MSHPVVYIGIGNTDNKLTQVEWAQFVTDTRTVVQRFCAANLADADGQPPASGGPQIIGDWLSAGDSPWQNACIAFTLPNDTSSANVEALQHQLARLAGRYRQDSIAWAFAPDTGFLSAQDSG